MRISDWSSDVCSSDLPEDAGSSWKIRGARPAGGKRAGVDRLFARRDARRTDRRRGRRRGRLGDRRSEEHTSELQSLMHISYAVFCLKKKKRHNIKIIHKVTTRE